MLAIRKLDEDEGRIGSIREAGAQQKDSGQMEAQKPAAEQNALLLRAGQSNLENLTGQIN
jgi:hypothetical protein